MTQLHKKRFEELRVQADEIASSLRTKQNAGSEPTLEVNAELLLGWTVKAKNLLGSACGSESEHLRTFAQVIEPGFYESNWPGFRRARAVFLAAQEDFEGGYLSSVRTIVQAEVFTTELDQARELQAAGYSTAAAVIAGVVLETNLRGLCSRLGLATGKVEAMNAALVKANAYNALVQKKVTALAAIRNSAAHGKTSEYASPDVEAMIRDVERLIEEWLR